MSNSLLNREWVPFDTVDDKGRIIVFNTKGSVYPPWKIARNEWFRLQEFIQFISAGSISKEYEATVREKFIQLLKAAGTAKKNHNRFAYLSVLSLRELWKLEHKVVYWWLFTLKHAVELVLGATETYVVNVDKPIEMVLLDCAIALVSPIAAVLIHNKTRIPIPAWLVIVLAGVATPSLALKVCAGVMMHRKTVPEKFVRDRKEKSVWEEWYGPIATRRDHWDIVGPGLSELFNAAILLNSHASSSPKSCLAAWFCF